MKQIDERNAELEESARRVAETKANIEGFQKNIQTAADRIAENERTIAECEKKAEAENRLRLICRVN